MNCKVKGCLDETRWKGFCIYHYKKDWRERHPRTYEGYYKPYRLKNLEKEKERRKLYQRKYYKENSDLIRARKYYREVVNSNVYEENRQS